MFQAFGYDEQEGIEVKEVVYTFLVLLGSYLLYVLDLKISVIL